MPPTRTRPLTQPERELIAYLLSINFPGADTLRSQLDHSTAIDDDSFAPSLELVVDQSVSTPASVVEPVPVEALSRLPYDNEDAFEVLLFVRNGWLAGLDITGYQRMPTEIPQPSDLLAPVARPTA